jgi:hypothetical protein
MGCLIDVLSPHLTALSCAPEDQEGMQLTSVALSLPFPKIFKIFSVLSLGRVFSA